MPARAAFQIMTSLLKISIPTFNRPEKITKLVNLLLGLELGSKDGLIKIYIYDNSDKINIDLSNLSSCGKIYYTWNEVNIGYAGNFLKCISDCDSLFTWVISDDDHYDLSEIQRLIDYIKQIDHDIAGIALPYSVEALTKSIRRTDISIYPSYGKQIKFKDSIVPTRIPFDYLSSFIIKSELLSRLKINNINASNIYIQSLVYSTCLHSNDKIMVYERVVAKYLTPDNISFSLSKLINSKYEICNAIEYNHGLKMQRSEMLFEVIKWGVFAHAGISSVSNLNEERPKLVKLAILDFRFKILPLTLLLVLPKRISRMTLYLILTIKRRFALNADR